MSTSIADRSDLRHYLNTLRRAWLFIGMCAVLCAIAAGFITSKLTPQYMSTSQIFISTNNSSEQSAFQGGLFSTQRVASYADAIRGREIAERVIDELDLDVEPLDLARRVTAEAAPETVLLNLAVQDSDPVRAQRINAEYGRQLEELVEDLETPPGADTPLLKATIIDKASRPTAPFSPNPVKNIALAVVLGLMLGVALTALRELLDSTIRTQEQVTAASGVAVTGRIGLDPQMKQRPLISQLAPHEPRAEAFRMLRTNLQYVDVDGGNKVYVVTSSLPGEGKSSTITNLAISIAQTGRKVIIVEADLRKPRIADILGLEPAVGLTTVLVGRTTLAEATQRTDDGVHVLTGGHLPPNPAELLQSNAMRSVLERLRGMYDYVLIDSPPLLPVTDAALLAKVADGALLVVRHGRTTREQLRHAKEQLDQVGASAVGTVLNMVPSKRGFGYGYDYGYGYGYGPDTKEVARAARARRRADAAPERTARRANKASKKAARAAERAAERSAVPTPGAAPVEQPTPSTAGKRRSQAAGDHAAGDQAARDQGAPAEPAEAVESVEADATVDVVDPLAGEWLDGSDVDPAASAEAEALTDKARQAARNTSRRKR